MLRGRGVGYEEIQCHSPKEGSSKRRFDWPEDKTPIIHQVQLNAHTEHCDKAPVCEAGI